MSYPLSSLPKWARRKLADTPVGERVQLTGTINATLIIADFGFGPVHTASLTSTTGHQVTLADLK